MKDLLLCLKPKQRKGSKPRCHWLTHGTRKQVAKRLTKLTSPWGTVSANDHWMPEGFCDIEEAQLHKATKLLPQEHCDKLTKWWLAEPSEESKTPNFDIASTGTIKGKKGMLLVEAKAHSAELKVEDEAKGSQANRKRIGECIEEANVNLSARTKPGWALSHNCRYQIANRFAWSSKLTELGYPVILVYLGFENAKEMKKGKNQLPFDDYSHWQCCVVSHSEPLFPAGVWNNQWCVHNHLFVPRILSCEIRYDSPVEDD